MKIRIATADDLPAIVEMGEKFHAFSGERIPYCYDSTERSARGLLDVGFVVVAESAGQLVGMIGVAVIPTFFNFSHVLAQELMWWVDEQSRGGGAALGLIRAAEAEAAKRGAQRLLMARLANSPPHVDQIYARRGYVPGESLFAKELQDANH